MAGPGPNIDAKLGRPLQGITLYIPKNVSQSRIVSLFPERICVRTNAGIIRGSPSRDRATATFPIFLEWKDSCPPGNDCISATLQTFRYRTRPLGPCFLPMDTHAFANCASCMIFERDTDPDATRIQEIPGSSQRLQTFKSGRHETGLVRILCCLSLRLCSKNFIRLIYKYNLKKAVSPSVSWADPRPARAAGALGRVG